MTFVCPMGKMVPDGESQVTLTIPELSEADGFTSFVIYDWLSIHLRFGASLSVIIQKRYKMLLNYYEVSLHAYISLSLLLPLTSMT